MCEVCGRSFNFPSLNPPIQIGEYKVESEVGRGRYAIAFRVRHLRSGITSVLKVTPSEVFAQPDPKDVGKGGHGDRRNFQRECQLHSDVSSISQVAALLDWNEETVIFGSESISVCWAQMQFVRGKTLQQHLDGAALSPRTIAQIGADLLRFSEQMTQHGVHHNDLHGGNAILIEVPLEEQRRRAFDPSSAIRIIDLGSASREDKSDSSRFSDLEEISTHMLRLLDNAEQDESKDLTPSDLRLIGRLRQVAQIYRREDWVVRRPTAADMQEAIRHAVNVAVHPRNRRSATLFSFEEHYNAQTMPAEFARELIYDPDGRWTNNLTGSGPQLVVGMRGCGKTMLFRSLEWAAQAIMDEGETAATASDRLRELRHLGLFVSCAFLSGGVRDLIAAGASQRLYLAYAREAIRAAAIAEAFEFGDVDYDNVEAFSHQIAATMPTFEAPLDSTSLHAIELALSRAILKEIPVEQDTFAPLEAFSSLATGITGLVDLWRGKTVLFLLDDLSKRFVQQDQLADLLTKLCLKSESFGFKISTETQTQLLRTPGGMAAMEGRDYQIFDLGHAVLDVLRGPSGSGFLEEILVRRQRAIGKTEAPSPKRLLGERSLLNIAEGIRLFDDRKSKSTKRRKYSYSGLQALTALCVGDIGDVLQIYQRVDTIATTAGRVNTQDQSRVLWETSEARLRWMVSLDVETGRYFSHAAAFAQASHRELLGRDRVRQYSDLFLEVDGSNAQIFEQVMELIDNGIYVIVGFHQRSKGEGAALIYQFHLKYRKLLGLTFGMPLANRDRFELVGSKVREWLESPSSVSLSPGTDSGVSWAIDWAPEDEDDAEEDFTDPTEDAEDTAVELPIFEEYALREPAVDLPAPGFRAECVSDIPMTEDTLDWADATYIAACGFEDRATGSWESVRALVHSKYKRSVLLKYTTDGRYEDVRKIADESSRRVDTLTIDPAVDPTKIVESVLDEMDEGPIILDVSSMTKPLIFAFTKGAMRRNSELWIVHTAAETYDPSDEELLPVLSSLNSGDFPGGLRDLDRLTSGEGLSFSQMTVGGPALDSATQSLLVFFVTIKHKRAEALLGWLAPDKIVSIRSVHSSGERNVQSRIIGLINQFLVTAHSGESLKTSSMGAQETFDVLLDYYRRYVLDDSNRIEIGLTGTKLQTVGAGMFASVASPAAIYYSVSHQRDTNRFTHGTGPVSLSRLMRVRVQ